MAEHEVTLGEVYRLVLRVDGRLDALTREMVGRAEYESDQEGISARFTTQAENLAALGAEVKSVKARLHEGEERGKNQRWGVILAVVSGGIALAFGIVSALIQGALR